MSKRSLYPSISMKNKNFLVQNYMHFLQYADGRNDIEEIAKILKIKHKDVINLYKILKEKC